MNPLLIISVIFFMSLFAAFVLFKWLKNTAIVKFPFGRFGGAVAAFIGVYLLIYNSYTNLTKEDKTIKLQVPLNYSTFISKDYSVGFGYPSHLKMTQGVMNIRYIYLNPFGSALVIFGVGPCDNPKPISRNGS